LRKGKIVVPALELLEVVLVALRPGIEPKAGTQRKTARGEAILSTTLGEASTIAASAVTRTGGVVSVEIATASLMLLLAEEARGSGTSAIGIRIPRRRPTSHGVETITSRRGGDATLAAPVKP
jgi:hypothetical protein